MSDIWLNAELIGPRHDPGHLPAVRGRSKALQRIFGESILHDAVAIVLYETLTQFRGSEIYAGSIFHGVDIFFLSFSSSMAPGIAFGLLASLTLFPKSSRASSPLSRTHPTSTPTAFTCPASSPSCFAASLSSTTPRTTSRRTQRATKYLFGTLAQLSDHFIFIYLGMNLFTQGVQVFKPIFIVVSVLAVLATRYAAVFPSRRRSTLSTVHRWHEQRHDEPAHSYQMMLFWAWCSLRCARCWVYRPKQRHSADHRACCGHAHGDHARRDDVAHARSDRHPRGIDDGGGDSGTDEEEPAWLRSGQLGRAGARWDERANARFNDESLGGSFDRLSELRNSGHARRISGISGTAALNTLSSPTQVWSADEYDSDGGDVQAATARPSLAACGTRPKRRSTRSTSATSCRCSPMRSRAGRSMRGARTGARGSQGIETVLVPVLATGRISWMRMEEEGVMPARARAGMYPLSRDRARAEGC